MAPRSKAVLAREHLDRALPAVAAEDHPEAVAWLFVSLEAAIVAVADAQGLGTKKAHWKKAEVAAELHATGVLPVDYTDTLKLLNEAARRCYTRARTQTSVDNRLRTSPRLSNRPSSRLSTWQPNDYAGHPPRA
jgi:hypothetical protein